MAFTPASPLNLVYTKFTAIPPPTLVTVPVPVGTTYIGASNPPNWVSILNSSATGTEGRFYVAVNAPGADTLSPGVHQITLSFFAVNYNDPELVYTDIGSFTIKISVTDNVALYVSPSVLSFTYLVGDPAPATKPINLQSANNWNITPNQSWVTLSASSGSNNATVQVGVDIATMPAGAYSALLVINDGTIQRLVSISLVVTATDTISEYLYLNPANLEFISEESVANATEKTLVVDTGGTWDAVVSETWLILDAYNGVAGINEVGVTVDSAALPDGIYQATITVSASGIIKKAYVVLRIVQYSVDGLVNGGLYYEGDRNQLVVSNINDNSFLLLQIEASALSETHNFPLSQPYFKGVAKALVGMETRFLVPSNTPPATLDSGIYNTVRPITINIDAYEEHRFTGITTSFGSYTGLKFLKGKTPKVAGRASYIPSVIYATNKASIQLTVVSENSPANAIITGAISDTINGGLTNGFYLYTLLLNLEDYTLAQGDVVNVAFGGQNLTININNDYTEHNTIAFENEWGVYELFQTRGQFSWFSKVAQTTTTKAFEGLEHTQILEAPEDAEFTLNTGYILTQNEVEWVAKILNSKRVFIYLEGAPVEVILTTNKLLLYETRNHNNSYKLQFKKAIK